MSGVLAAIDAAVADGVDILSYSIGGSANLLDDPDTTAFRAAASAGIYVAAAAGNDGPEPGSVLNPGPWVTTVAAGVHDRAGHGTATVTLGSGAAIAGEAVHGVGASRTRLVLAEDVRRYSVDVAAARICSNGTLDTAKAAGAIVVRARASSCGASNQDTCTLRLSCCPSLLRPACRHAMPAAC